MATVAGEAAGCVDPDETCAKTVSVLGLDLAAGSLPFYLTSFATIASAFVLPIVGAFVDRSSRKKWHMGAYAWAGSFFCALLFFLQGDFWQLGAVAVVLASIMGGCSLVSYYAILVDISTEEERDHVSSRGWAFGYLGGGLLLAVNLAMFLGHDAIGLDEGHVRPAVAAVGRDLVGRLHDHPDDAAAQLRAGQRGRRRRHAASSAASASCSPR